MGNPHRDEYSPEAERILARADEARTPDDLAVIVRDVFEEMFGPAAPGAGSDHLMIAQELWAPLQELVEKPSES